MTARVGMDEKERAEKFLQIVRKHRPKGSNLRITSDLAVREAVLDSMAYIELVYEIENELDVVIPDDKVFSLNTIGDVLDLLKIPRERIFVHPESRVQK